MLGRFKSIQSRFFILFLPPVLVVTAAVMLLHGYFTFETLQEEFSRKQEEIVFNNSIALVEPMDKNNFKRVKRVLDIITADPDVIRAEVKDLSDKIVAKVGLKSDSQKDYAHNVSGVITDVIADDADWEVLGTLDVVFSKRRILNSIQQQIFQNSILILLLITTVVLGAFFVLRIFVQKPLNQLATNATAVIDDSFWQRSRVSMSTDFGTVALMCDELLRRINELEDDVKARGHHLRAALETSPAGVVIATRDGKGLYCNSEYAEQYGGSREEMLSINPHLNYADSKDRDRLYQRLAQDGRVDGMDIQMRRKDGSLWWARCTWLPVKFEGVQGHIGWMVEINQASAVVKIA
jgi:PAS domain S-box-containing protein